MRQRRTTILHGGGSSLTLIAHTSLVHVVSVLATLSPVTRRELNSIFALVRFGHWRANVMGMRGNCHTNCKTGRANYTFCHTYIYDQWRIQKF